MPASANHDTTPTHQVRRVRLRAHRAARRAYLRHGCLRHACLRHACLREPRLHPLSARARTSAVTKEFKTLAKTWPLWESKTHPQKPAKSGKFHVRRSHPITRRRA